MATGFIEKAAHPDAKTSHQRTMERLELRIFFPLVHVFSFAPCHIETCDASTVAEPQNLNIPIRELVMSIESEHLSLQNIGQVLAAHWFGLSFYVLRGRLQMETCLQYLLAGLVKPKNIDAPANSARSGLS